MKALAPLTLDLQPRPVHRSVPVMHANGSGGVAQTVTPDLVVLQWELETNSGILHVCRNVNYTERKTPPREDFSQSLGRTLFSLPVSEQNSPNPNAKEAKHAPRAEEPRAPAAPVINYDPSELQFHPQVKTKLGSVSGGEKGEESELLRG